MISEQKPASVFQISSDLSPFLSLSTVRDLLYESVGKLSVSLHPAVATELNVKVLVGCSLSLRILPLDSATP